MNEITKSTEADRATGQSSRQRERNPALLGPKNHATLRPGSLSRSNFGFYDSALFCWNGPNTFHQLGCQLANLCITLLPKSLNHFVDCVKLNRLASTLHAPQMASKRPEGHIDMLAFIKAL
jgi:hypothetical protein